MALKKKRISKILSVRSTALFLSLILITICIASCKINTLTDTKESTSSTTEPNKPSISSSKFDTTAENGSQSSEKTPLTESDIIELLKPSLVKVICYSYDGKTPMSQGSGIFIDSEGTFITSAHVLKDCYFIRIQDHLGQVFEVDRLYASNDTTSDHAVCRATEITSSKPVEFADTASVGDTVYALGYPENASNLILTSGEITNDNAISGGIHYYENTASVKSGNSGGALVNADGKVIGIIKGFFKSGASAAIQYNIFKNDVHIEEGYWIPPYELYHKATEIDFSYTPPSKYFSLNFDRKSDATIRVSVRLLPNYRFSYKINIDTPLNFKIEFNEAYYGDSVEVEAETQFLDFTFSTVDELTIGVYQDVKSSFDSVSTNDIGYQIDFYQQSGKLIFFK